MIEWGTGEQVRVSYWKGGVTTGQVGVPGCGMTKQLMKCQRQAEHD